MQCTTLCHNSYYCGAFTWDDSAKECSLYGKTDFICDKNGINSISAYVDQINFPSSTCGGTLSILHKYFLGEILRTRSKFLFYDFKSL